MDYFILSDGIKRIIPYAFENFEIVRLFARPYSSNIGSQKVLEKCGFKLEARLEKNIFKNGVYQDELIYVILKK